MCLEGTSKSFTLGACWAQGGGGGGVPGQLRPSGGTWRRKEREGGPGHSPLRTQKHLCHTRAQAEPAEPPPNAIGNLPGSGSLPLPVEDLADPRTLCVLSPLLPSASPHTP